MKAIVLCAVVADHEAGATQVFLHPRPRMRPSPMGTMGTIGANAQPNPAEYRRQR